MHAFFQHLAQRRLGQRRCADNDARVFVGKFHVLQLNGCRSQIGQHGYDTRDVHSRPAIFNYQSNTIIAPEPNGSSDAAQERKYTSNNSNNRNVRPFGGSCYAFATYCSHCQRQSTKHCCTKNGDGDVLLRSNVVYRTSAHTEKNVSVKKKKQPTDT